MPTGTSEFGRLWGRTSLRRATIVVVTVLFAAAAAAYSARAPDIYHAEVVLRIADGGTAGEVSLAARELRRQILDVAFTAPRLVGLMRRLGMGGAALENDPQSAVRDLREAIDVRVWQQIYLTGGVERPSRVTIGFRSSDRKQVAPLARGLAALLVDSEAKERRADLEARARMTAGAARQAALEADQTRRLEAARPRRAPSSHPAPAAPGEVSRSVVPAAETRLRDAQAAAVAADLRLQAAKDSKDLRFDVVDDGQEPSAPRSFWSTLTRNAILAAAVSFPVWMLIFGAFEPRLTGAADAARLGLGVLGAVPGLPGPTGVAGVAGAAGAAGAGPMPREDTHV